jgi:EAL domain-containing protein (putative c-di-GMP-specific phosphodiesterase class I)
MLSVANNFPKIEAELQKFGKGTLLLIKLVNLDEIQILTSSTDVIISKVCDNLKNICENQGIELILHNLNNNILIILPELNDINLKSLIEELYVHTQLFKSAEYPEVYINCYTSYIHFPLNNQYSAELLYKSLLSTLIINQQKQHYCPFQENLDTNYVITQNQKLLSLRNALKDDTVKFHYQPIVDRKTGNIPYYECLLRIPDQAGNLVSVGPLIKLAEAKGLINLVDRKVLSMAIEELLVSPELSFSINISNIGVLDHELLIKASDLLTKYPVGDRLIFEITETSLNEDFEWTKHFMLKLKGFGCRFALDDFGSGYTSFKQIKNLPIDIIKIDGSYIRDILSNNYSQHFVQELIRLSEELGIKTVAEFVENGEIAKLLIDLKVDGMQGNFFSPASRIINQTNQSKK